VWKEHEYSLGCSAKMAIAFVVHDEDVDDVVKLIVCQARTGQAGNGHVSGTPIAPR
jgi:nitrogen regulatory protein PII